MRKLTLLLGIRLLGIVWFLSLVSPSFAENFNLPIEHIIVVVQENRTINNLFANDTALASKGAHFTTHGKCGNQTITLLPFQLDACFDNSHEHSAWLTAYDQGQMDKFCKIPTALGSCSPEEKRQITTCTLNGRQTQCPAYTTVNPSQVETYFQIAANGGFANYMFQTNQGPSFPAHQFLFSGTSAPIAPPNSYYDWFAAENANLPKGHKDQNYGCIADIGTFVYQLDPSSGAEEKGYTPTYGPSADQTAGYPCYEHNTLGDVLDKAGISWTYYSTANEGSLWNAPNAIYHICEPSGSSHNGSATCTGSIYNRSVADDLQIFTDLGANPAQAQCTLSQVSWVIPDGNWSDHPGVSGADGGPSWVAAIVNAVGGYNNDGSALPIRCGYWANTVVLVTWDDWGGFYEDVDPIVMSAGNHGKFGYPGTTNGSFYVYGYRVPLLVSSTFAKTDYISGAGVTTPVCPNFYCHDFGSILNFIEYAFGTDGKPLSEIGYPSKDWHYADYYAQDKGSGSNDYGLYDFFNFKQTNPFVKITGAKYDTTCFLSPDNVQNCFPNYPKPPDNDGDGDLD